MNDTMTVSHMLIAMGLLLFWDVMRRFADGKETVDPEEFQALFDEVQNHAQHLKESSASGETLAELETAASKLATMAEDHKKVLASHATALVDFKDALAKQGRAITDLGLAKTARRGGP